MRALFLILSTIALVALASPASAFLVSSQGSGGGSCDGNCEIFQAQIPGQWTEATVDSNNGNFAGAYPLASGNNYDGAAQAGGTVCSGTGPSIWSCPDPTVLDTTIQSDIQATIGSNGSLAYSAPTISKANGYVVFKGGGHATPAQSGDILGLDMAAAGVAGAGTGNWLTIIQGPMWLADGYSAHGTWPGQLQRSSGGCNEPVWYSALNAHGQNAQQAGHSYWGIAQISGTTRWVMGATNFVNPADPGACLNNGGAIQIIDASAKTSTPVGTASCGTGAYNDLNGQYYALNNQTTQLVACNLSTGVQTTENVCATNAYPTGTRGIIIPDPASPLTERDYFSVGTGGSVNAILVQDITHGGTVSRCPTITFPAMQSGEYPGSAYDDDDGNIYYWDGTGNLFKFVINFSSFGSSTVTKITRRPSGDIPASYDAGNPAVHFNVLEYLPKSRPNSGGIGGFIACGYARCYWRRS